MEITKDSLNQHYKDLGTDELVELYRSGGLSDNGESICKEELYSRGIGRDELLTYENEIRTLHAQDSHNRKNETSPVQNNLSRQSTNPLNTDPWIMEKEDPWEKINEDLRESRKEDLREKKSGVTIGDQILLFIIRLFSGKYRPVVRSKNRPAVRGKYRLAEGSPDSLRGHWQGRATLFSAYWFLGVLGNIVFSAIAKVLAFQELHIVSVVFGMMWIAYSVFALTSIWRCSWNTSWKGWGYIARTFVVIHVIIVVTVLSAAVL